MLCLYNISRKRNIHLYKIYFDCIPFHDNITYLYKIYYAFITFQENITYIYIKYTLTVYHFMKT